MTDVTSHPTGSLKFPVATTVNPLGKFQRRGELLKMKMILKHVINRHFLSDVYSRTYQTFVDAGEITGHFPSAQHCYHFDWHSVQFSNFMTQKKKNSVVLIREL